MTDTPNNPTPSIASVLLNLNSQQKMGFIFAVAASIAVIAGLWMWGQTPDYRVLYANLSDRDGGAIIESLQQQDIPYKFAEGGGALLVPRNLVHETRLRLASQGLPKGGTAGFELMESQKFGTSQFLEQVNYQRSLEGELARSMQTLAAVQSARVHLAIPKPSVFVKDRQKPSASVVLTLFPGRLLDPGQVNGIVHLVSSSIPNMSSKNVTILDQSGNMLNVARESNAQLMDETQLKYVRNVENDYIKRIEAILSPITGPQNVKAQVTASIDFSRIEETAETYKPNQRRNTKAIRSSQTLETLNTLKTTEGVPGALSNQPPADATMAITKPGNGQGANSTKDVTTNSRKEATSNFELNRTIQHTKLPAGNIRRLSVAVVINNPSMVGKDGKITTRPYTQAENAQINALVKEAMGFDTKRGDSLNVLNQAFNTVPEPVIPEVTWWKDPNNIPLAKDLFKYIMIAAGIGFLLFGVIRPTFRNLAAQAAAQAEAAAAAAEAEDAAAHHGHASQFTKQNSYEDNLELAKQLTKDDPKIVASVVKEWVNKE